MVRAAHDVRRQTILRKYAEAKADRPPEMKMAEDLFMIHTKTMKKQMATHESDTVWSNVFNFHSNWWVLIENLKTKAVKQKCVNRH